MVLCLPWLRPSLRTIKNDSNIDDHVILKILISRNKSVSAVVLEADAVCGTFVETVEILDSSHNRVGSVVREDLHPHWQSCSMIGSTIEQQLECDILRRSTNRGGIVACWSTVAVTLTDGRGSKGMSVERYVIGHDRMTCRVLMQPLRLLRCSLWGLLRARVSGGIMR